MKLYRLKYISWIIATVVFVTIALLNNILNYTIQEWIIDMSMVVIGVFVVLGVFLPYDTNQSADNEQSQNQPKEQNCNTQLIAGQDSQNATATKADSLQNSMVTTAHTTQNDSASNNGETQNTADTLPASRKVKRSTLIVWGTLIRVVVYALFALNTLNAFWYVQQGKHLSQFVAEFGSSLVPFVSWLVVYCALFKLLLRKYNGNSRKWLKYAIEGFAILLGDMAWLALLGIFNKYAVQYNNSIIFYIGIALTVVTMAVVIALRKVRFAKPLYIQAYSYFEKFNDCFPEKRKVTQQPTSESTEQDIQQTTCDNTDGQQQSQQSTDSVTDNVQSENVSITQQANNTDQQ